MDSPGMRSSDSQDLGEFIKDAQNLVRYVVREGLASKKDTESSIKAIISASSKYGKKDWNSKEETNFLNAYRDLSIKIAPVTLNTVQSTIKMGVAKPLARRVVFRYSTLTIFVLVTLVVLQIYWVVGSINVNLIAELEERSAKITEETASLTDRRDLVADLKKEYDGIVVRLQETVDKKDALLSQVGTDLIEQDQKKIRRLDGIIDRLGSMEKNIIDHQSTILPGVQEIRHLGQEQRTIDSKLEITTNRFHDIQDKIDVSYIMLSDWSFNWSELLYYFPMSKKRSQAQSVSGDIYANELALNSAKSTLNAMSSYVLPLLYGLLGACAHILRMLTRQIREVTFSPTSVIRFRLRWPLGMLAGIAVGWFFGPEQLPSELSALQPLALAFLAGYSVELLFTGMDNLIDAFTKKETAIAQS